MGSFEKLNGECEFKALAEAVKDELAVTDVMKACYAKNGYVLVRGLLNADEVTRLKECVDGSRDLAKHAFARADGRGKMSRLCLWNLAGDDVFGVAVRTRKIAHTMEELMGQGEIYHYHSKLMMKEAKTGGSFVWHQDYGYWYNNGCLRPNMGSIFLAIDRCIRENGCLQVLRGSHRMGRIDHRKTGEQAGADLERVEQAKKYFPLDHVQMEPGDVLFFHCNLLHTSAANSSDLRRYALITAVNAKSNEPFKEHHHPKYHKMVKLDNDAILQCHRFDSSEDKAFLDPNRDVSHKDNA